MNKIKIEMASKAYLEAKSNYRNALNDTLSEITTSVLGSNSTIYLDSYKTFVERLSDYSLSNKLNEKLEELNDCLGLEKKVYTLPDSSMFPSRLTPVNEKPKAMPKAKKGKKIINEYSIKEAALLARKKAYNEVGRKERLTVQGYMYRIEKALERKELESLSRNAFKAYIPTLIAQRKKKKQ